MAKISFVLVFAFVLLALPLCSVLGQEDWKDLLDQGGFSQDSLKKAQMAFGAASAQAAVNDYFGLDDSPPEAAHGEQSSLADFLDADK